MRHRNFRLFFGGQLISQIGNWLTLVAQMVGPGPATVLDVAPTLLGVLGAIALVALAFLPSLDIAVTAFNQVVTTFLPPRTLPKLDLGDGTPGAAGIPPGMRTAIVVPTLLTSVEQVKETLANLESQYLANRAANLHFAILSDFTDAPAETMPADAAIVAEAVAGIRDLNERHHGSFVLFHRPRQWNARQGTWMGWERKRGKLEQFNLEGYAFDPAASQPERLVFRRRTAP